MKIQTDSIIRNLRAGAALAAAVWCAMIPLTLSAQNVLIIESQSYNSGHAMDLVWQATANNMGMSAVIGQQSELLDTSFFPGTDALIISSGVIILSNAQINTIHAFVESGKSMYLQGEYDCNIYNTNTLFESMVNDNGGNLNLNGTIAGTLAPMNVSGTLASTPNTVNPLSYFWYGCRATACANVEPFLEFNGDYFGFVFCPPDVEIGRVVYTSDQDWVNQSTSIPLLENILTLITGNAYQCAGSGFFSVNLGVDTAICEDSTYLLQAGNPGSDILWSDGSADESLEVDEAGTYWVTVSNGNCTVSDTVVITEIVCNSNVVQLAASDTLLCQKFCISYTGSSSNGASSWLWTFEGGLPNTSSVQNPTNICYDLPGTFDVILIATGVNGSDTLVLEDYIQVYPTPLLPVITQTGNTLTCSPASFYQWQLNTVDIPGATNQSYAMSQSGFYTVYVFDEFGCKNSSSDNYFITGIEDLLQIAGLTVFPNPSAGIFLLESQVAVMYDAELHVTNAIGEVVYQASIPGTNGRLHEVINLSNEPGAVFILYLTFKDALITRKLVVLH